MSAFKQHTPTAPPCIYGSVRFEHHDPPEFRVQRNLALLVGVVVIRIDPGNAQGAERANDTVDAGVEVLAKAHERGLPVIVEAPPSNASGEHAIEGRFRQRAGTHSSLN